MGVSVRDPRRSSGVFRGATVFLLVALLGCAFLFWERSRLLDTLIDRSHHELAWAHSGFESAFQASYYFFFRDQFVPEIDQKLGSVPGLKRVQFVNDSGGVLYDTGDPELRKADSGSSIQPKVLAEPQLVKVLSARQAASVTTYRSIHLALPSTKFWVIYSFDASSVLRTLVLWTVAGFLGLILGALVLTFFVRSSGAWLRYRQKKRRIGLRVKILGALLVLNALTGSFLFFSLTSFQRTQEEERIKKESTLFSQFSSERILWSFSNYFYFYYQDRFLPAVKGFLATNENLLRIRIVSFRNRVVRFDSWSDIDRSSQPAVPASDSLAGAGVGSSDDASLTRLDLGADQWTTLENRGVLSFDESYQGENTFRVLSLTRNEHQEPLFVVEYLFGFETLKRSLREIRAQILRDLIPSLVVGFALALILSQLLIGPIRALSRALGQVQRGDFDATVEHDRSDEIGDLIESFNRMTNELRKKQELRKYLSDSTYRQISESIDATDGSRLRGTRIHAAILFSDIRNFVGHTENLGAEEVTALLNDYFTEMVDVISHHGGEIDKFIGDALLAVFYAKTDREKSGTGPIVQALTCALEMRERLTAFNQKRIGLDRQPIDNGVGITFGEIISGPIGSKDRRDFTVIGEVVNLASRIEKLSKKGKHTRIVFSGEVETFVHGLVESEPLVHDGIQGIDSPVQVFELVRIRELKELQSQVLSPDLDVRLRSVEVLGLSRNLDASTVLTECLSDPEERVRIASVRALSRIHSTGDTAGADIFFSALKRERSPRVVSVLVSAIGEVCRGERLLELKPYLDHEDERIVANAIESMSRHSSPEVVDLVIPKLASRHNRVKANAAMTLFGLGRAEVVQTLKPMLLNSDPLMRSSAAFALGELGVLSRQEAVMSQWKKHKSDIRKMLGEIQECVPMLVLLLRDPEPMVKRQAVIALGKMKDKTAVLPLIHAVDFDRDSKELIQDVGVALRNIGSHQLVRDLLEKIS